MRVTSPTCGSASHALISVAMVQFACTGLACGAPGLVVTHQEPMGVLVETLGARGGGDSDSPYAVVGDNVVAGQRYALFGQDGLLGFAVVVGPAQGDCDHCPSPRFEVRGEGLRGAARWAVGPLDQEAEMPALTSYTDAFVPTLGRTTDWHAQVSFDLDGDSRADLERVSRCGSLTPSGCLDSVCEEVCYATRAAHSERFYGESCQRFIPDIDECPTILVSSDGDLDTPEFDNFADQELFGEIYTHREEVTACYREALRDEPGLSGRLTANLSVDSAGRITWLRTAANSVGPRLESCLISVVTNVGPLQSPPGPHEEEIQFVFAP